MTRLLISLTLCFQIVTPGIAQQPAPRPSPRPTAQQTATPAQEQPDVDVVKITTNLVQIDAVVTDRNGKHVTDLRPEEIEMFEDGKSQKVTNFSYIRAESAANSTRITANKTTKPNLTPEPPRIVKPENVHRTIALVVDDLSLSFESAHYMRRALRKFLDEMMQPNDLVAIIRTAGGMGALQQFTTDKRQLYAAVEKVKWYPHGRGSISAFAPIGGDGLPTIPGVEDNSEKANADLNQFREDLFTVGTLGALNYVVKGLRQLPGRKSIVLFADGLRIFSPSDPFGSARVLAAMRILLDLANRASVVINTMDARGLQTLGLTAADSTGTLSGQEIQDRLSERRTSFYDSQEGLNYLASETGGLAIRNTNDLVGGIKRIMEDQSGYYLIGYRPDDSTFDRDKGRARFHKISLKIKRPGKYNVRMRSGFLGVSDDTFKPATQTPQQQLVSALLSPFSTAGVQLRLTSLFANDVKVGSLMRSFLHVKASDLTFTKEPDGTHKAVFDILLVTFGDNGMIVGQFNYRQTMRVKESGFQKILKNGFSYNVMMPIKKPGAYQLRTALRDLGSSKVGSASQFIEVPDIKKDRLQTSGLLLKGMSPERFAQRLSEPEQGVQPQVDDTDPLASTAVRQFRAGMAMVYGLVVYNAKIDKETKKPHLKLQARLFRDGQLVFTGTELPFDAGQQTDMKRLGAGGAIQLGSSMEPGQYMFQIIVTDVASKDKKRVATQWMDFEIVN